MNYNKIDKKAAKSLNIKQSVLIETINAGGKTSQNIYLNNSRKRSEVFNEIYNKNFKPSTKKDEVQKSYRILKFQRALDEIGNKGAKEGISFYKCETYKADPVKAEAPAAEVATPEE